VELSEIEFKAMNHPLRRLIQRGYELPGMRKLGLEPAGRDILEIGCGSGYAAQWIAARAPHSYTGIDVMPEQIALAKQRGLEQCTFIQGDAADLAAWPEGSFDLVVDFGILHHVPAWKRALAESLRVLRPGGLFLAEEPEGAFLRRFERVFHWGHPEEAAFSLSEFMLELADGQAVVLKWKRAFGFFWISARKDANART